jgi:creatinine amidohydrolase
MSGLMWADLSTTDIEALDKDQMLVLLPIGSMEQHGPHMPLSTDTIFVDGLVKGVLGDLGDVPYIVLPAQWCSKSNEHAPFPGTVFLRRETFAHLLMDIGASVARAGFRKLVLMNWHGGNTDFLASLARDIRYEYGLMVFTIDVARLSAFYPPPSLTPGVFEHAGSLETSIVLALRPELLQGRKWAGLGSTLQKGKVAATFPKPYEYLMIEGGPVTLAWLTKDLSDDGVFGDPGPASAEVGAAELAREVALICGMLREIAAFEYRVP